MRVIAGALALTLLSFGLAEAQAITGQIVDERTDEAVEAASIVLLDSRGVPAGPRALSNAEGRFQLALPPPGNYRLEIQRLGYDKLSTLAFEIREGDTTITLRVILVPRLIELDPITLEVRRRETLTLSANALDQFRYRAENGFGDYITKADIGVKYPTLSFESLVRSIPWLKMERVSGRLVVYAQQGTAICGVKWWMDGRTVWEPAEADVAVTGNGIPASIGRYLLEVPAQLRDLDPLEIEGIEMYRGITETPGEFIWTSAEPFCAAIVVWTVRSRRPGDRGGERGGDGGGSGEPAREGDR